MKPATSWGFERKKHGCHVKPTAQIDILLRRKLVAGSLFALRTIIKFWGIPRKLQHTPISHTRSAIPLLNYERIPGLQPVGKGFFGVCSSSVCWNNLRGIRFCQATIQILLSLLMSFRNIAPISSKKFRGGRKQRQSNGVRKGKKYVFSEKSLHSLKLKTSLPLKIDSWKTDPFLLRKVIC